MDGKARQWNVHYGRDKSRLSYPDENLVRLASALWKESPEKPLLALDLGCGSGRHIRALLEIGIRDVFGVDYSMEALGGHAGIHGAPLVCGENTALPFRNDTADIVVTWGSLHYSDKEAAGKMLSEIHRVLKSGGYHIGTLRSSRDTYIKRGTHLGDNVWITDLKDLNSSTVSFYDENELQELFSLYGSFSYGIMERTLPGDMTKLISHWYYQSRK